MDKDNLLDLFESTKPSKKSHSKGKSPPKDDVYTSVLKVISVKSEITAATQDDAFKAVIRTFEFVQKCKVIALILGTIVTPITIYCLTHMKK